MVNAWPPNPIRISSLIHFGTPLSVSALQSATMADAALLLHETHPLKEIVIDYTPEACSHCAASNTIALTYDHRGGARWRTATRFHSGTFSARIRCPGGDTSGLNFNLYLSSLEGDKSQDEIDFEFLGRDRSLVQTNVFTEGAGNRERFHELGFDASDGFHEYVFAWGSEAIEWRVDGKVVRREERKEGEGEGFPRKPMFLYASIWDASGIDEGSWCGKYCGKDQPYVCLYKDIRVPLRTAVG
ncbi:putative xyloglucan endotransglucosylase/hydrolase protein 1 [Cajanus cajan]|uniref:putative xyloglucan endotransglucosylase/hydrolase protein 1 n=1 Tax=Cajanus cajan TaxID=3821 RepID=UPI00098D85A3|nr:putative xyloglucan endotransglucosylase/hydrolase protein 1 [Cajanus cajan]